MKKSVDTELKAVYNTENAERKTALKTAWKGGLHGLQYTLKELRARHGLTQQMLADKIGVSATTVRTWEKFPARMQVAKLQALADVFGVRIDEIFLGLSTALDAENGNE